MHGSAWSSFGEPIEPITQDTAVFFEQQAIIADPRVARDASEADFFAHSFGDKRVAIQEGHGLFATGASVDEATWFFLSMDRACSVQLKARAAGTPKTWPNDAARGIANALGSGQFGWLSFQPLWDEVVAAAPDVFA